MTNDDSETTTASQIESDADTVADDDYPTGMLASPTRIRL